MLTKMFMQESEIVRCCIEAKDFSRQTYAIKLVIYRKRCKTATLFSQTSY